MVRGIYLDGRTSKPHQVRIALSSGNLIITDDESDTLIGTWHLSECKVNDFNSSQKLQIAYGEFPQKSLEINSHVTEIRREIDKYKTFERRLFDYSLHGNSLKTIAGGLLVLVGLIWLYVTYVSTYVGKAIVDIIPMSIEEKIGNGALNQYEVLLNIDSSKSLLLNDFYEESGLQSNYDIQIYYDSSSVVNAFALPGGNIVVYQGLLDKMESWQELAALLSHELVHVNQRHTLKIMSKQIGNYAVFSAITGDMVGVSGVILEQAINFSEVAYSRSFEKESDVIGLQMLVDNEIRPSAMLDLLNRLKKETENAEAFLKDYEFLSSHPLTNRRIEYITADIHERNMMNYQGKENLKIEQIWQKIKLN